MHTIAIRILWYAKECLQQRLAVLPVSWQRHVSPVQLQRGYVQQPRALVQRCPIHHRLHHTQVSQALSYSTPHMLQLNAGKRSSNQMHACLPIKHANIYVNYQEQDHWTRKYSM